LISLNPKLVSITFPLKREGSSFVKESVTVNSNSTAAYAFSFKSKLYPDFIF
jgi:hypothetical protein